MSTLASFSSRVSFTKPNGTLTTEASRWIQREVLVRVGGPDSLTNAELAALVASLASDLLVLTAQVNAQGVQITALETEIEAVIVGEQVFQVAPADVLGEMSFQE